MNIVCTAILAGLADFIQALPKSAASTGEELTLQAIGFISFGLMIILFQFVPAAILFGGLIAGMIRRNGKNSDKDLARDIKVP